MDEVSVDNGVEYSDPDSDSDCEAELAKYLTEEPEDPQDGETYRLFNIDHNSAQIVSTSNEWLLEKELVDEE